MSKSQYFEITDFRMHYVESLADPETPYTLVMIHGGHRTLQNISAFAQNIEPLGKIGRVIAVDLLGHGNSIPNENAESQPHIRIQVDVLEKLLLDKFEGNPMNIVLVGRSYGGAVAIDLTQKMEGRISGLVLISPAGSDDYEEDEKIHDIPVLLVWSRDDPIIPFSKTEIFKTNTKKLHELYFDDLAKPGEEWRAHSTQSEKPEEFNAAVEKFLHWL